MNDLFSLDENGGLMRDYYQGQAARSNLYDALRRRRRNASRNQFGELNSDMGEQDMMNNPFQNTKQLSLRGY